MKNYVEIDEQTLEFKYPYRIHIQKPEDVPTVEIETDDGIPMSGYEVVKEVLDDGTERIVARIKEEYLQTEEPVETAVEEPEGEEETEELVEEEETPVE